MSQGKSIARYNDMIAASSSRSDVDNHESLGVNQEQAHPSTHDVESSRGVHSQWNPFTHKYQAQWKDNLSM
jgi:hypothetical protein